MHVAWILGLCFADNRTETCTLSMKEEEADAWAEFESNLKGRLQTVFFSRCFPSLSKSNVKFEDVEGMDIIVSCFTDSCVHWNFAVLWMSLYVGDMSYLCQ